MFSKKTLDPHALMSTTLSSNNVGVYMSTWYTLCKTTVLHNKFTKMPKSTFTIKVVCLSFQLFTLWAVLRSRKRTGRQKMETIQLMWMDLGHWNHSKHTVSLMKKYGKNRSPRSGASTRTRKLSGTRQKLGRHRSPLWGPSNITQALKLPELWLGIATTAAS